MKVVNQYADTRNPLSCHAFSSLQSCSGIGHPRREENLQATVFMPFSGLKRLR
jgi:hypothetical protein